MEYNIQKKKYATELRKNMTPTEKKLWYFLRADTENTWLRQKILGEYIVDFYCSKKHLVIELDGETHI
jgi:very-short-patch-repair endonuclease